LKVAAEVSRMNGRVALRERRDDAIGVLGTVEQAMSKDVVLLSPDTHVGEALVLMEGVLAGNRLVVDTGRVIGVVSLSDLIDVRTLAWRTGTVWGPGHRQDGWRVADVMTPCRRTISAADPLVRAVGAMYEEDLERVPVENGEGEVVGVLTRRDVMRAVAALVGACVRAGPQPSVYPRQAPSPTEPGGLPDSAPLEAGDRSIPAWRPATRRVAERRCVRTARRPEGRY
jgi:CBS domain-containing protein